MKTFLNINISSFLYAVAIFIPLQFMININRIMRLTDMSSGLFWTLNIMIGWITLISIPFLIRQIIFKTTLYKSFERVICLSWFVYFVLCTYLTSRIIPITNEGDMPSAGLGFILILILSTYPLYIIISKWLIVDRESKKDMKNP